MTGIRTGSQTVVVIAMALVAVAGAVALYQHAALPAPVAATAALSAYLLLLTAHVFAWRASARNAGDATVGTARDRRDQEVRRLKDDARTAAAPAVPPALPVQAARGARSKPQVLGQPALPEPQRSDTLQLDPHRPDVPRHEPFGRATLQPAAPTAGQPSVPPPIPPRFAEPQRATPPPLPTSQPASGPVPPPSAPVPPGAPDDMQDYWSIRPTPAHSELPPFVTGRASARPAEAARAAAAPERTVPQRPAAPEQAHSPREADVEVIQDAIKRLLEEVNASEQNEPRAGQAPRRQAPAPSPEQSVDQSIDALRMTAGAMRSSLDHEAKAPPLPHAPRGAAPLPPPLPPFVRQPQARPADTRARQMADAISAGRIDVALEPILGLEDQQTRHYEVSVRLRDAEGRPIEVGADSTDLRGTGLLPLFDGVRIARTALMARRLEERGKLGSVFSTFSGESVADEHFLGELAETLHQRGGLATQLVLSFTQSDVRAFSTPEWDSLADMRALGFRFAVSHLTDLDMDFEALAEQGFSFVKLDASVFLSGLPTPSGRLPSSDVCRHLASHGLALVVERIESDDQLARVFGFGVLLGQGQLFGGPRPVRADVVNTSRPARTAAA